MIIRTLTTLKPPSGTSDYVSSDVLGVNMSAPLVQRIESFFI